MTARNIIEELDSLVKRASEAKAEVIKTSSDSGISAKLDNADDGTSPATTGEQAAAQTKAQDKMYPDNMVDTGAKDNKSGGSVEASTDGATAAATDGQSGSQGAVLEPKKEADNGEEKSQNKVASADLRKTAEELRKAADALLTPLDRFLVASVRNNKDPEVVKTAEALDDAALADASSGALMGQIDGGGIGEEEAAAILEEALQAGAITPEELQEAIAATSGGAPVEGGLPAEPAPAAAPAEEMAPEVSPIPADAGAPEMANLEEKLAAANIGPDDPKYIEKLASLYAPDIQAGYAFGLKLAEELVKSANEDEGEEKKEEKEEEKKDEGDDKGEAPAEPAAPAAPAVPEAPVAPAPEAPVAPAAPMPEANPLAAITPEEQQALAAVQAELGLDDAAMAQLMAQQVPAAGLDKVAEAKIKYRTAILNKVAALREQR